MASRRAGSHPRLRRRLEAAARDASDRADLIRRALASANETPDAFRLGDAHSAGVGE
jgi:hypothetical protein